MVQPNLLAHGGSLPRGVSSSAVQLRSFSCLVFLWTALRSFSATSTVTHQCIPLFSTLWAGLSIPPPSPSAKLRFTGRPFPWCEKGHVLTLNSSCCLSTAYKNSLGAVATTRLKGAFTDLRLSQSWISFMISTSLLPLEAVIETPAQLRAGLSSETLDI